MKLIRDVGRRGDTPESEAAADDQTIDPLHKFDVPNPPPSIATEEPVLNLEVVTPAQTPAPD